jgi:subtilisin family serine protease
MMSSAFSALRTSALMISFAIIPMFPSHTMAGVRVAVSSSIEQGSATEQPDKLAPELRAAVDFDATFIGFDDQHRAVLEFPDEISTFDVNELASSKKQGVMLAPSDPTQPASSLLVGRSSSKGGAFDVSSVNECLVYTSEAGFSSDFIKQLEAAPDTEFVEPNYKFELNEGALAVHSDEKPQWGLDYIHVPPALSQIDNSLPKIVVAIIDSGIEIDHADLVQAIWNNKGEIPGNEIDDDQNGYIDDVNGYDFVNNDASPEDRRGHGTHVAGIIGAVAGDKTGVAGVSPRTELMALKVFDKTNLGNVAASADRIADAIDYAANNGARIINASWGGGSKSRCVEHAVERAKEAGVLVVASAGNGGSDQIGDDNDVSPQYPSSYAYPEIIAVAAGDNCGLLAPFSNFGAVSVDLVAPGVSIYSTMPRSIAASGYSYKDGTSMAAPFVSGVAALLWSLPQYKSLSSGDLAKVLLDNARRVETADGKVSSNGYLDLGFVSPGTVPAPDDDCEHQLTEILPTSTLHAADEKVLEGIVKTPEFELGGETSGIKLQTATGLVEVEVGNQNAVRDLLEDAVGKQVRIRGLVKTVEGLETGVRTVIEPREVIFPVQ